MRNANASATSATLLGRLRHYPPDQEAWADFVERYSPRIHGWCRQWGLQEADAADVTQEVLLKLHRTLCAFAYDPSRSFRGWLRTVTRHAWSDFFREGGRCGAVAGSGDSQVLNLLNTVEAREDLLNHLDEEFDHEILEEAMARVRLRVAPHTWEAFRLTALEGLAGADVAPQVGMQVAMVWVAKSKVTKLLRHEIRRLEGIDEKDDEEES